MLIRFLKMVWIVFETQVLRRVNTIVAAFILIFPLIVFILIFKQYEHLIPTEIVPIIYLLIGCAVFGGVVWKATKSKKRNSKAN